MKRIKVLYLITGINVGGAERLLLETVRNLDRGQFEPVVVSLVGGDLEPEFRRAGIHTVNVGMARSWPLPGAWRVFRILRREKPDIVHTHLIHADFFGRVLGRLCGVPILITTLHMVEEARRRFPYLQMDRFAARFTSAFIAVSGNVKKELVEIEGLDPEKITVIHNGIADLSGVPLRNVRDLRAGLKIDQETILLGIVSRLEAPRKGHQVLFEALGELVLRYPRLHCAVIGDGTAKEQLQRQVHDLGLQSHVTFAGTQRNIPEWLKALDIFVLPSLLEGFPMAIIEAMAAARPVIATRVGGVGELIEHQREGLLIEADNVQDLVQAIERLVLDPDLRCRLGHGARRRFEDKFEIQGVVEALQRLYDQCLRESGISKRVHLLEVVTNFEPGGVPRHVEDLVRNLSREQFKIEFVSGETIPQRIPPGVEHHYVGMVKPIHPLKDLGALGEMVRLFRKLRPDIVHSHMSKANCLASVAARIAGVRCVLCTIHGQTILSNGFSFKQFLFDIVDLISLRFFAHGTISISRETVRHLTRWRKVHPSNNVVIYNGIGPFPADGAGRQDIRRSLGINDVQKVIVMTGRLVYQKVPEVLIQACALLRDKFPGLVCLIVGEGPKYGELVDMVQAQKLNDTVRLLGHRNDVPQLLRAADVFVLCTRFEGQSISVLEAMAAALPVVVTNVPGMDEVVLDGETGYLIEKDSPQSCAGALARLLSDPEKCRLTGQAGYQRFRKYFTFSRQLAQTQELLLVCGQNGFPKDYIFREDQFKKVENPETMMASSKA